MLIEFTVKNYRSIKDEQVFSMVKAKGNELENTNSFQLKTPANISLLRSAAIYGANAAGKSNIIQAMMKMESIVCRSASSSQEGDEISVTPFIFDESSSSEPTEFEIIFISKEVRYQFGFSATKTHIIDEWLIAYPKGRAQKWYSRSFNKNKETSDYKFSDFLLGQKSVWQNATRTNALFLSTAVQLNSEQLKPVFNWFKETLRPTHTDGWDTAYTASQCIKENTKAKILEFMQAADFDIYDIQIDIKKLIPENFYPNAPNFIRKRTLNEMNDRKIIKIKTIHQTESGSLIPLDFNEESDGTQKFFSLAGPWINALEKGYVLVIDELHDNLHPKMVQYLINLFHNDKTNPNNAQLIFTTHETSILSQDNFRRDQIWFCEKDTKQATSLYPLTDFSPRKDRENIELGYLSGRYGAIPFTRPFNLEAM